MRWGLVLRGGTVFLTGAGEVFPDQWLHLGESAASEMGPSRPHARGDWLSLPLDGSMALEEMDCYIIETALEQNNYNATATARALGTTRETLRYRIHKYGLRHTPERG